ncbi:Alkanesulfonates-binding protein [Granulibacter bethesdensis]|uniref:Putative aliphatic sulfonates-binding protein n=2 Tax=Granulibacter bethesdensis TaxID=364410 RepID=A0AAC9P7U1_9PROT|nr:Alkanesulfonates-binding protein [Granulibacter bethesdensis]APH61058.1 Alkanesulfonates-binding protein [Granulibacter bethesdensis]
MLMIYIHIYNVQSSGCAKNYNAERLYMSDGRTIPQKLTLGRRGFIASALAVSAMGSLTGIVSASAADGPTTIRIGFQKYGTLVLLRQKGWLEKALESSGHQVVWSEFPAGPQLLEAMAAGAIDFGSTGETPPVFAQAANDSILYVGVEPPAPHGEAILVPGNSPIKTVADLRGRTVGLNKGANVHWLLLKALQNAGLMMKDIHVSYLAPADGAAAFDSGRLDAWAIWDPYLSSAQERTDARVLVDGAGLVENREFFLAGRSFARKAPGLVRAVLDQLALLDHWAETHKEEVALTLSAGTRLPLPVVQRAVKLLPFGVSPITPDVVASQQAIADAFADQHLLPGRIRVADAVWHEGQSG